MQPVSPADLEALKATYAEQGYVVLRDVISKQMLAALRERILAEFERSRTTLFNGGGQIAGHLNCFPGEETRAIYQSLLEQKIVEVVQAVHPRKIGAPYVGLNLNLPGSIAQHYHMDGTFLKDFIILNVAVVDTDLVNGAIDLLATTHKKFYPYWKFILEGAHKHSTRISMNQGDVLIRGSILWHRGMPNNSETPRPMLALTFDEDRGVPPPDPFKINGGKIEFQPNWFRPTRLGRLRERTFAAAPITYEAYRFVRSLVGKKGYAY